MESTITKWQMIAYLNKTINEWTAALAAGEGEPWMHDAIAIEKAIVNELRPATKSNRWPLSPLNNSVSYEVDSTSFDEDYIGSLIRQRVALQQQVNEITIKLEGARLGAVEAQHLSDTLEQRRQELLWTLNGLRDAKQRHKLHLQQRLAQVQSEIASPLTELVDEVDLRHLEHDILRKIEVLDNELKQL